MGIMKIIEDESMGGEDILQDLDITLSREAAGDDEDEDSPEEEGGDDATEDTPEEGDSNEDPEDEADDNEEDEDDPEDEETDEEKTARVKRAVKVLNTSIDSAIGSFNEKYQKRNTYAALRKINQNIEKKVPDGIDMEKFKTLPVFAPSKDEAFTYLEILIKVIQKFASLDVSSHLDPDSPAKNIKIFSSLKSYLEDFPSMSHKETKYGDTITLDQAEFDSSWKRKDFGETEFDIQSMKKLLKRGDMFIKQSDGFTKQRVSSIFSDCKFKEKELMKLSRDECRAVITRAVLIVNSTIIVSELIVYVSEMLISFIKNIQACPKKIY